MFLVVLFLMTGFFTEKEVQEEKTDPFTVRDVIDVKNLLPQIKIFE